MNHPRPEARPVMLQSWRNLLFLHFALDAAEIQALLPPGLTVDTFEGQAYVGLVPFEMHQVRLARLPAVPGTHTFAETNVRTYVIDALGRHGVWFFSLEAANRLAVRVARARFALPYHFARMSTEPARYSGTRVEGGQSYKIQADVEAEIFHAQPGSLEFFLAERYRLFAFRRGQLFTGEVHHVPYPLQKVTSFEVRENLVDAAGIDPQPFTHALYSQGVDVEVFPLTPVVA